MEILKSVLRTLAYRSGLVGLAHRVRNRHTLTVFMFHRVLPSGSDEYRHSEREFTFTCAGFAKSLDFIRQHYNVIDLDCLKAHVEDGEGLPDRAGLITFDDGWRDTATYALPELEQRGLPAVLFLATDVLDSECDRWWQDALVEVLLSPGGLDELESRLGLQTTDWDETTTRLYRVTAHVGAMAPKSRNALLATWELYAPENRQMLNREEVSHLGRIRVAGHGHSHIPLTAMEDVLGDLRHSRATLAEIGADTDVMSFPHGAVNDNVRVLAQRAGFSLCFDSRPVLMDTRVTWTSDIGRIHIPENMWTTSSSGIDAAKLASFLFFRSRTT